jgi:hypothetical protein
MFLVVSIAAKFPFSRTISLSQYSASSVDFCSTTTTVIFSFSFNSFNNLNISMLAWGSNSDVGSSKIIIF